MTVSSLLMLLSMRQDYFMKTSDSALSSFLISLTDLWRQCYTVILFVSHRESWLRQTQIKTLNELTIKQCGHSRVQCFISLSGSLVLLYRLCHVRPFIWIAADGSTFFPEEEISKNCWDKIYLRNHLYNLRKVCTIKPYINIRFSLVTVATEERFHPLSYNYDETLEKYIQV